MAGGECTRAILCFVLAAVVSTRPTAARGDVPAGPSVPPAATLRVDTDPADAHVYVRDASSDRSRICIGHCTLLLPPGTWHLDAGFSHRHLQRAPAPVILAAGDDRLVNVRVEDNALRFNLVLGSLIAAAGLLTTGVIIGAANGAFTDSDALRRPPVPALVLAGAGCAALGFVFVFVLKDPVVTTHEWSGEPR